MGIWLRDRDACNCLYLLILSTRTARDLNRLRTPVWRFWKQSHVARLFSAERTRGVISRRLETDYYSVNEINNFNAVGLVFQYIEIWCYLFYMLSFHIFSSRVKQSKHVYVVYSCMLRSRRGLECNNQEQTCAKK